MTADDLELYAVALAAVLRPKRLPRSTVRVVLVQIGLSGVDADAIIEHGLAAGMFAQVNIFGEPYLFAAPLPRV